MYVHKVIDFIDKSNLTDEDKHQRINSLKQATHFFIGNAQELRNMIYREEFSKIAIFSKEFGEDFRLPYPHCCFSYNSAYEDKDSNIRAIGGKLIVEAMQDKGESDIFLRYYIAEPEWVIGHVELHFDIKDKVGVYIASKKGTYVDQEEWRWVATILNFTLMFLNCKNIVTEKNLPPAKLNKKRIKNKKQPLFSYYTLKLKLPNKRAATDGEPAFTGNTVRLHFCRGHFKTYTKEKPLFGKYTGRYWCQAHARGDETKGTIKKDYELKAA